MKKLIITTRLMIRLRGTILSFSGLARMIISGYEYRNEKPFSNVYFTGMVRDNKAEKCRNNWAIHPTRLN